MKLIVYYSILIILLYLGVIKKLTEKYEKSEYIVVFLAAVTLFFFAAMRGIHVGVDTKQYCSHFVRISATEWHDLGTYIHRRYGDIEFGYKVYNKLLSVFRHKQTITIANSLLQIGIISIVIVKQSKDKWLSYFLYFSLCFYQTALNLTPSSIVSYFMFLSFPLIIKRKLIPFLLFVAAGMMFHTSAVFFIPLYFLYKLPVNRKTLMASACTIAGSFIFFSIFNQLIIPVMPAKYIKYIDPTKEHTGNTVEILVLVVLLLGILYCLIRNKKEDIKLMIKGNPLIVWLLLYQTFLYLLSLKSAMFQRGAFLLSPYSIIIIPGIIAKIEDKNRRTFTIIGITVYGIILYILRLMVNNVGTTVPYEFFFES